MNTPDPGLVRVPVQAAVLRATANLLELLSGFLTATDPAVHLSLGSYLIDRHCEQATTDSIAQAVLMLNDLTDAAELLHTLADD